MGNQKFPRLIRSTPELSTSFPRHGLRATQRDARRLAGVKQCIQDLPSGATSNGTVVGHADEDTASTTSAMSATVGEHEAVEPTPWSIIAYTSLIWWASAGDRRSGLMEAEELANEQDEALLRDTLAEESATREVVVIAYFHKLSMLIFSVLSNAVSRYSRADADRYHDEYEHEDDADGRALLSAKKDEDEPVEITEEDVRTMGLDIWSESDKQFIAEMIEFWWNEKSIVRSGIIECCGIRIL